MTTLALARQKISILSLARIHRGRSVTGWFQVANRKGLVTAVLLATIFASAGGYLLLLSRVFELGFQMQDISRRLPDVTDELLNLQLELQQRQFVMADAHASVLGSMEKVSGVKYLTPETVSLAP